MVSGRTVIHAIVGAVVGIVLSFIPFSTVIGGAVAGFLEGPNGRNGAIVGALAGAVTFVPFAAMALFMLGIVGFGMGVTAVPIEGFAFVLLVTALLSMTVLLYTVGLSLVGGYLGAYLAREYPEHRTSTRRSIGMEAGRPSGRRRPEAPPQRARERDEPDAFGSDRDEHDGVRQDAPAAERFDPTRWHEERESDSAPERDRERNRESEPNE
ncbi:DUF5518 domain-containing protein [Halopiger djelfimassiliensis]|uniref:DUF5518 domain-containing protein n=1 Tax=Halopiger djelfimassiliensis TaxID=1293047 RepID=UPI0006778CA2|nr:DUF5518 domain-containing protein [Halopiger djelfimassiliensis]